MNYKVSGNDLTAVADAIRTKGGTSSGLSFPDGFVSAIGNIPSGGGATLIQKSITQNGTYDASDDDADGYSEVNVAVPMRSVTGTFTGEESGEMTITIPYSGSGYPIAVQIYPTDGVNNSESEFYSKVQRYAESFCSIAKSNPSISPDYTSGNVTENRAISLSRYKYSDSDPTSYTTGQSESQEFGTGNAGGSAHSVIRFSSNTTMKVYIASNSYGFAKDISYTYHITYSS